MKRKIRKAEKDLRAEIGSKITPEILSEGVWSPRATFIVANVLDGKPENFPKLVALASGVVTFFDPIILKVDKLTFLLHIDKSSLVLARETKGTNFRKEKPDCLLPLIKKYNLRLDFSEINGDIAFKEKEYHSLMKSIEYLHSTQA
jgi:hypothetical protein